MNSIEMIRFNDNFEWLRQVEMMDTMALQYGGIFYSYPIGHVYVYISNQHK